VPNTVAANPQFILSVASGAVATVFLATWLGFPVSTTHALIGGLVGAGLGLAGGDINLGKLGSAFFLPLLLSPMLAACLGFLAFKLQSRRAADKDCMCVVAPNALQAEHAGALAMPAMAFPSVVVDTASACSTAPAVAKISISATLNRLHIASAFSICFARAVNDTPKLAALLIAAQWVGVQGAFAMVCIAMAAGGLLFSRKVAVKMSQGVSRLDHAQGFSANVVTSGLVLLASFWSLPVSTTHVSVGSIAGAGAGARSVHWASLRAILLSWLATLPVAAVIAWGVSTLL
jgi:inorganic phosphate transporter, PiT family